MSRECRDVRAQLLKLADAHWAEREYGQVLEVYEKALVMRHQQNLLQQTIAMLRRDRGELRKAMGLPPSKHEENEGGEQERGGAGWSSCGSRTGSRAAATASATGT